MHDMRAIRENPEAFDDGLRRRGLDAKAELLIALDERRRAAIAALQSAQERRNAASKQIGIAMARKDSLAAEAFRAEVAEAKAKMPQLEAEERDGGDDARDRARGDPQPACRRHAGGQGRKRERRGAAMGRAAEA